MIFVTVGTHEQPFDRLIEKMDKLKEDGMIQEDVIIQSGFSKYKPKHCEWRKLLSYEEMVQNVSDARIVITHGGPASFIMPLQIGKIPIVVPRQYEFGEHINNHQVDFSQAMSERMGNIIIVLNLQDLVHVIMNYNAIISSMSNGMNSNNEIFNKKLEQIVNQMCESHPMVR